MNTSKRIKGLVVRIACATAGVAVAASTIACAKSPSVERANAPPLSSTSFVVVHGAWQGAWAWSQEADALRARGATVTVIELPGHGDDNTPVPGDTLDAYVAKTTAAIDAAPTPVVLVGHSLAGAVITQAAEARPDRVAKLVYLAAYVPKDGQPILDLANTDADSHIGPAITIDKDHGIASIAKDRLGDIFCADCSPDAQSKLTARYRDEPLPAFVTPVHSTPQNWGRVRKFYVFTRQDHAVSYALQQRMTAGIPWSGTFALDTGHSPFMSAPGPLADALTDIARQ